MSDPARRYRVLLRLYPEEYRSVRADEIVATLLDAADQRRLARGELFYLFIHAATVWARAIVSGLKGRPLPQPVRFVTWVLVGLATWNWLHAALNLIGHHPDNAIPPGPLVAGFVFFGLHVLIQARRRLLYVLAVAVIASFVVSGLIQTGPSIGALVEVPYATLGLLLLIGWRADMAAIAQSRETTGNSPSRRILGGGSAGSSLR
jgi:hypothetical protein